MTKTPLDFVPNPFLADTPPPEDLDPAVAAAAAAGRTVEPTPPAEDEPPPPVEDAPPAAEDAPPAEDTPETPANPAEKVRQPSRKDLSTQLEAANAELAKLRADGEVYDQKYKDAVARQAALEKKIEERDKEYVKTKSPVYRWEDDPEVAGPRKEVVDLLNDTIIDVAPETGKVLQKDLTLILSAYGEARSLGAESLRLFKEKLVENFGEDATTVLTAVRQMHPKHVAALEAQKRNSEGYYSRTVTEYTTRSRTLREEFSQIGRMTPEQIAAAPDSTNAIISAAIAGDETMLKEIEKMAHKAAQATAGLPPLPPTATAEEIEAYRATERNLAQFKETQAFRRDVEARALQAIVKKLSDENAALKKRVEGSSVANRPDTTAGGAPSRTPERVKVDGEYAEIANPYLR